MKARDVATGFDVAVMVIPMPMTVLVSSAIDGDSAIIFGPLALIFFVFTHFAVIIGLARLTRPMLLRSWRIFFVVTMLANLGYAGWFWFSVLQPRK